MRRTAGRTPAELERLIEQAAQKALCRATLSQLAINSTLLGPNDDTRKDEEDCTDKEMDFNVDVIIEETDIKAAEKDMAAVFPSSVLTAKVNYFPLSWIIGRFICRPYTCCSLAFTFTHTDT